MQDWDLHKELVKVAKHLIATPASKVICVAPLRRSTWFQDLSRAFIAVEDNLKRLVLDFGGSHPAPGWEWICIECAPASGPDAKGVHPVTELTSRMQISGSSPREDLALSSLVVHCSQFSRSKPWAVNLSQLAFDANDPGIYIQYCHARLCG